ncbi:MAG TPA: hypothetical protein VII09_07530, partial [Opitutaceae bacterium]
MRVCRAPVTASPSIAFALCVALANGCAGVTSSASEPSLPPLGIGDGGTSSLPPLGNEDGGTSSLLPPGLPPGRAPRPVFGSTVTASIPPPPISGGTLLVTHDGHTAVAADPDRDAVYVVDVWRGAVTFTIALQPGDEPGRVAEDGAGRVHVALRKGAALVTIDPATGAILARRDVCPAPRGVAWDATTDLVWVACATGELVALPAAGGAAARSLVVERDLRDVIIQSGALSVTTFRSAEVLRLTAAGSLARRDMLPSTPAAPPELGPPPLPSQDGSVPPPVPPTFGGFAPHVAWRAVGGLNGSIVIAHQDESTQDIQTKQPGAYGAGGPIVHCEVTTVGSDGVAINNTVFSSMVLPVDVAISPDGTYGAVVSAGVAFTPLANVGYFSVTGTPTKQARPRSLLANAQAIAIAFDAAGDLLVQSREPAALWVEPASATAPTSIALSTISRDDTAHDLFHAQAGGLIACASCHPEGGDDGHVWQLDGAPRRTPSLRGTIAGTAPYHWPGDEPD